MHLTRQPLFDIWDDESEVGAGTNLKQLSLSLSLFTSIHNSGNVKTRLAREGVGEPTEQCGQMLSPKFVTSCPKGDVIDYFSNLA